MTAGGRVLQGAKLAFVMYVLVFIAGPITGPQAIFTSLGQRGLFSDKCSPSTPTPPPSPPQTPAPVWALTADTQHSDSSESANTTTGAPATGPCLAQEQAIESGADLVLSVCNALCVFCGVGIDIAGARVFSVVAVALWTVFKALAGVAPATGIPWIVFEAAAATMSLGAFSAIGLAHLKDAARTEGNYAFWSYVCSAVWDVAVLFNLVLAKLFAAPALPLWAGYAVYGIGFGVPAVVGLALWDPQPPAAGKASDSGGEDVASTEDSPALSMRTEQRSAADVEAGLTRVPTKARQVTIRDDADDDGPVVSNASHASRHSHTSRRSHEEGLAGSFAASAGSFAEQATTRMEDLKATIRAAKEILVCPAYWVFVGHCTAVVSVGYFLISNVGSIARRHGAVGDEVGSARTVTTYLMSAVALTNLVPGQIVKRLGTRRGLVTCTSIQCLLIASVAALLVLGRGALWVMYLGYGVMFVWRVWGFGMTFSFISWRFAAQKASVGISYGFAFTVSGAGSTAIGAAASSLLHKDPDTYFAPLMIVLAGASAAIDAALIATIALAKLPNPAGPTAAAQVDTQPAALQAPLLDEHKPGLVN